MKASTKLLSILMVLILALSACSSSGGSKNQSQGGTSKSTSNSTSSSNNKKVTITYARGIDSTKATTKLIAAFEKKYPNIKVNYKQMPNDSGQQHDQYVTALNAKSSNIDVMDLDVVWPAEFAQAGYVLPLDRFIQKDGIDLSKYNQGALSAATFNGKQWAMPKFIATGMLFYRKDLVPSNKVPKTWDQLYNEAKAVKTKNNMKFGYVFQAKQYEGLVCDAIEFISSYGGKILDKNGNVVINSPQTIAGLKELVKFTDASFVPKNINTFTETESANAFIQGQSPFIRNWPYQYALANDKKQSKIAGKVAVAALPAGPAGTASALGGWMSAINKYSKHKEAAWKFLKFMTGPEGQKINAIYGGTAPTYMPLYKDKDVLKANPFYKQKGFVDAIKGAVSRPVAANYQQISEIIQINISKAISHDITVEQAVKNMETQLKAAIKK